MTTKPKTYDYGAALAHFEEEAFDHPERAAALAEHLDVDPDDITEEGNDQYAICKRRTKFGDSPEQIAENVTLCKKALGYVLTNVETLTPEVLRLANIDEQALADMARHAAKRVEEAADAYLTQLECFERTVTPYESQFKWDSTLKRARKIDEPEHLEARLVGLSLLCNAPTWIESLRALACRIRSEAAELDEINRRRRDLKSYRRLETMMREHPDAAQLLDEGIHTVLNTLYRAGKTPACEEYPRTQDYIKSLHEAWTGQEIIDRRESGYADSGQYMVLDDDEANSMWEDQLNSYLDDGCVEGADGKYFDREAWKKDARRDGRGHCLNGYDGTEIEHRGLYIYRTN